MSSQYEMLTSVLQGNAAAVAFCETVFAISQTLDDLVDQDKPVLPSEIFKSYWQAMIELPANPFYRAHEPFLRPLMAGAMQDWWDATEMEKINEHGQTIAFVLRDQLTGIVVQSAGLIGGLDWMQQVSVPIRQFFHEEKLEEYKLGLRAET